MYYIYLYIHSWRWHNIEHNTHGWYMGLIHENKRISRETPGRLTQCTCYKNRLFCVCVCIYFVVRITPTSNFIAYNIYTMYSVSVYNKHFMYFFFVLIYCLLFMSLVNCVEKKILQIHSSGQLLIRPIFY